MNRKRFLRLLGFGSVAAVVAPKVLAETTKKTVNPPRGLLFVPEGITPKDFLNEWNNTGMFFHSSSPALYMGENKYKQFQDMCFQSLQSGKIDMPDYMLSTIGHFRGMRVVKHPLLKPDECIKVNAYPAGSPQWFGNIAISS